MFVIKICEFASMCHCEKNEVFRNNRQWLNLKNLFFGKFIKFDCFFLISLNLQIYILVTYRLAIATNFCYRKNSRNDNGKIVVNLVLAIASFFLRKNSQ